MHKELIDRATVRAAIRMIRAETLSKAKGRGMTAEEVEALMQRIEAAIKAAPNIATMPAGFKDCAHFPKGQGARGCAILTELTCAVKGKCSFFVPMEGSETHDDKAEPLPPNGFPENLRAARMAIGLSATRLAAKVGISRQRINKWENGEGKPSAESLAKLSALLGVSAEELQGAP